MSRASISAPAHSSGAARSALKAPVGGDVGDSGAGEDHRRCWRACGGDTRGVSEPLQECEEAGGECFGATEELEACARIEHQAVRPPGC